MAISFGEFSIGTSSLVRPGTLVTTSSATEAIVDSSRWILSGRVDLPPPPRSECGEDLIPDEKTGVEYVGICVECRLRSLNGLHEHHRMGLTLDAQDHRCFFFPERLDDLREGNNYEPYFRSWSISTRDDVEYVRMTIEVDEKEPTEKITVWKLTGQMHNGLELGTWPD